MTRTSQPYPGAHPLQCGSLKDRLTWGDMEQALGCVNASAASLPPRLRSALCLLLQAWDYAEDCQRDAWDFAVEIQRLRQQGLTHSDLRWLLCKGLTKHGTENTLPADKERSFRPGASLAFAGKTCFILTTTGLSTARQIAQDRWRSDQLLADYSHHNGVGTDRALVPQWDSGCRELRWASQLVKRYRLPAPNQELILTALEEEDWPPCIDDPLPRQPGQDPKQRLHDTIKNLNRHQVHRLLVFKGDGTGEGVQWRHLGQTLTRASPEVPHGFP